MSKRAIKRILLVVFLIALVASACGFFENQESLVESAYYYWISPYDIEPNPNLLKFYPEERTGIFQFDPRTTLASLEQGKTNIFTPSLAESNDVQSQYDGIAWSQSDFLQVADALSRKVWHEPLNLDQWNVYFVLFEGGCNQHFGGFYSFEITYYRTTSIGSEINYTARHIGLFPYLGEAEWAGDGGFSTPFIFGWNNVALAKFKITAEQAVHIADENGGRIAWVEAAEKCSVYVDVDENIRRNTGGYWLTDYWNGATSTSFSAFINPFTGEFRSAK